MQPEEPILTNHVARHLLADWADQRELLMDNTQTIRDAHHDLDALLAELQYCHFVIGRLSGMAYPPERFDEDGNLVIHPHEGRWATPEDWMPAPDASEEEWLRFSERYTQRVRDYKEGE